MALAGGVSAGMLLSACPMNVRDLDLNRVTDLGARVMDSQREYTPQEEAAIGAEIGSVLLGAAPLEPDARLQAYVNRVGRWLANQTERSDLAWRFGVLADDNVNAYAVPDGYVFVTRGLLRQLKSEAQLAGVLGHEMGHVLRRHHIDAVRKAGLLEALGSGAVLAAETYQTRSGSQAPVLNPTLSRAILSATREIYTKGLDRDDEYEADRIGLVVAARGGYDPYAFLEVLQMLESRQADDSALALMFKTHPKPRARLEQLDRMLGRNPLGEGLLLAERFRKSAS